MIDEDIRTLMDSRPDITLDHLESDVWTGVMEALRCQRIAKIVAACQGLALVLVFLGAFAVGVSTSPRVTVASGYTTGTDLQNLIESSGG